MHFSEYTNTIDRSNETGLDYIWLTFLQWLVSLQKTTQLSVFVFIRKAKSKGFFTGLITESVEAFVRMYCYSSLSYYKFKVLSYPLSLNHVIFVIVNCKFSSIINQSDLCINQGNSPLYLE